MAESISELRELTEIELIERHDKYAQNTVVGTNHYLAELARRDTEKSNKVMLDLTRQMRNLTIVILLLTVINVLIFISSLVAS